MSILTNKRFRWGVFVFVLIICGFWLLKFWGDYRDSTRPGQSLFSFGPDPVVVRHDTKESDNSSIFDYVAEVNGVVRNRGSAGYIRIDTELSQSGSIYKKMDVRFMESGEQINVSFTFSEAEAGISYRYSMTAKTSQR